MCRRDLLHLSLGDEQTSEAAAALKTIQRILNALLNQVRT
jgi:hypothetical protein